MGSSETSTVVRPRRRIAAWGVAFALLAAAGAGWLVIAPRWFGHNQSIHGPSARVAWMFETPERGAIVSSPLLDEANQRLFVGAIQDHGLSTSGSVLCLDAKDKRVIWSFDNDGLMQHMYSSPCLWNGRIYIGEGMHANHVCNFYCVNAATGKKLWQFQTAGHIESSPCVVNGKVFFASGDDGIFCLDALTGQECWHFQSDLHIDTSPTVLDGKLYAGSGLSRVCKTTAIFCLDAGTGSIVWQHETDLPVWGSPTVVDGQVYYGLGNGRLIQDVEPPAKPSGAVLCVDARTGDRVWSRDVPNGVLAQPIADERCVYFGCRDGNCYAVERRDATIRWRQSLGSPMVTRLAHGNGCLFAITSSGKVARLDRDTGQIAWTFDVAAYTKTEPRMFSSPTAVVTADSPENHRLYFGAELRSPLSSAAIVFCLQESGEEAWR